MCDPEICLRSHIYYLYQMEFLRNNVIQLLGIVFAAGISFSELRALHNQVDTIEERLNKKIKSLNRVEERVSTLEKCGH